MGIKNKDIEKLTMDDMKPVTISFKKNDEEFALYKWIINHSNYSGFVKDTLSEIKDGESGASNSNRKDETTFKRADTQSKAGLIDLDF